MAKNNVVRHDVVQIDFEADLAALKKVTKSVDDLKDKITGGKGNDVLDDLKDSANDSVKPLRKVKEEAEKVTDEVTKIGKKASTTAYNGLKKLAGVSFKAMAVGIGAATAAVGTLVAKSVSAYAEFEQLKGGVDTLFKGSADTVMKYANDAYKTAGLSANEYMETVTGFSASLLQSLGGDTEEAAKYAHVAITDMSDNANKMGTDMGSIQYAYQGFAKQNYTMLDNLKLGYGGTQEEMKRLIKDAAKLDKSVDANSMSFANIIKAINVVQKDMGIYGTTSKEAADTITGSLNSLKSAWKNLLPALIQGDESLDQCIDNLIDSAKAFLKNIKPAITKALSGIGKLVEELVPVIADEFPKLAEDLLPPLLSAAASLFQGFIRALPTIVKTIVREIPKIVGMIWDAIVDTFGEQLPFLKKITGFFEKNAGSIESFFAKAGDAIIKFLPIAVALVGAFKAFNALKGLGGLFGGFSGGSGGKGGSFSGFVKNLKSLAKVKTKTVLRGMANLAIILGGFALMAGVIVAVSPIVAMIADWGAIAGIILSIAALGAIGAGLAKMGEIVGKVPVSTVAKGLANMAIMIAGMSVLVMLVGAVAIISFNYKRVMGLVGIIGALGTVGGALAVFAGIVGAIPIPVVAMGLANMAIVIGGLSVLLIALAALNSIPGFNEFIKTGGELLITIFNILGRVVGALVGGVLGGIGESLTTSLVVMGENISKFAASLQPAFEIFGSSDVDSISKFFGAFGGFMLTMTGEKFLSFFTGGVDFASLGRDLTKFAQNSKKFFKFAATLPKKGFENASAMFECLAGLSDLPHTGGVVQWFSGEVDYAKVSKGLSSLSNQNVKKFFEFTSGLKEAGAKNATKLFECLAGLSKLPSSGGVVQWFCGEVDYTKISKGLSSLSNEGVKKFFKFTSSLAETGVTNATKLFECLSRLSNLPYSGGLSQWFSGEVDYAKIANGLASLSNEGVKKFFNFVGGLDESGVNNSSVLFEGFSKLGQLPNSGGIGSWFKGEIDYGKIAAGLAQLADEKVKDFFVFASKLDPNGLDNGLKIFSCLAGLSQLPSSGGIGSWFSGEIDYVKVAAGMGSLAGEGVKTFFAFAGSLEEKAVTNATKLFTCFAGLSQLPSSGGINSWFCGEIDYSKVAGGLSYLSNESVKKFFTFASGLSDTAVDNATKLFICLAGLSQLPSSGGIRSWFCGDIDYGKVAGGLESLSGDGIKRFFAMVKNLDESCFDKTTALFIALNSMGGLPNSGGIGSWFGGDVDYNKIASGVGAFGEVGPKRFFLMVQKLTPEAFTNTILLFKSLSSIGSLGEIAWFASPELLGAIGEALGAFAKGAEPFFKVVATVDGESIKTISPVITVLGALSTKDFSTLPAKGLQMSLFMVNAKGLFTGASAVVGKISALQKVLNAIKEFFDTTNTIIVTSFVDGLEKMATKAHSIVSGLATDIASVMNGNIASIVKSVSTLPTLMGEGIKRAGSALSDSLVAIWKDAVTASAKPINKLIEGANWVLSQFGANKTIPSWVPYSSYARGTNGHKGGNALVNDGRGAELVQMPNGNTFIPKGRNVFLPNAPQGMKVLSAERTAHLMGRSSPTFRYESGVGDVDIWSYIDNYKGLASQIASGVSYSGLSGFFLHASKGIVSTASGQMATWIEKVFDEHGAKSIADYVASEGVEQWRSTVIRALKMEGQYTAANVQRTLYQMQTESGGNPMAINLWDSNAKKGVPSKGLMQVIDPTFDAYARAGYDKNIYDPLSNILASVRYAMSRYGSLASAYRGVGYGNGAIVNKPTWGVFGEEGAEANIPLEKSKRRQGLGLWAKAGEMLGVSYSPDGDAAKYSGATRYEENVYAPVFNLEISGTNDDREMARKVKRWVAESVEEMFTSMASKNRVTREV